MCHLRPLYFSRNLSQEIRFRRSNWLITCWHRGKDQLAWERLTIERLWRLGQILTWRLKWHHLCEPSHKCQPRSTPRFSATKSRTQNMSAINLSANSCPWEVTMGGISGTCSPLKRDNQNCLEQEMAAWKWAANNLLEICLPEPPSSLRGKKWLLENGAATTGSERSSH